MTGKDIDVIQVTGWRGGEVGKRLSYEIDYAVKGHVKRKEESLQAKIKREKKGFLRRQTVDFEWTGGEIAELLNKDHLLQELILQEQILDFGDIEIKPDKKKPYVRIHHRFVPFLSEFFPSEKYVKLVEC